MAGQAGGRILLKFYLTSTLTNCMLTFYVRVIPQMTQLHHRKYNMYVVM